jgi:hypothetical protein
VEAKRRGAEADAFREGAKRLVREADQWRGASVRNLASGFRCYYEAGKLRRDSLHSHQPAQLDEGAYIHPSCFRLIPSFQIFVM